VGRGDLTDLLSVVLEPQGVTAFMGLYLNKKAKDLKKTPRF